MTDLSYAPSHEVFVRCYTFGHSWHDYDSNWKPSFGTPLTLRCERCTTERRDTIGASGNVVGRHYHYPPGYRYGRGEGRPTRDEFRVMLLAKRIQEQRQRRRQQQREGAAS